MLSVMLFRAQEENKIQGVKISRHAPSISHLLYADDLVFFFKATPEACEHIKSISHVFGQASGLVMNKSRSSVWFSRNAPRLFKRMMAGLLGIRMVDKMGKMPWNICG